MIQKRFIAYSLIIHLLAMSLLFISPVAKEQNGKPFFARLVTAEDIGARGGDKAAPLPVPSRESASLPRSSNIPSAPSFAGSNSPQDAKSQESPAHTTEPSGSMSNGSEDLKSSQSGIPQSTEGGDKAAPLPVPSRESASLPRSSREPSIPSASATTSESPQSAKSREALATATAPLGSMSNGSEDLKSSQSGIPHGTGGGTFPLKRETIDNITQQGKGFSAGQSAKEEGAIFAKKTQGQEEKSSLTFDVKGFKYDGYMMRLKDKIEGIWQYPSDAAMRGIYGDLYLSFTIKKNGSLSKVELVRTSGYRSLDEAAMKALKDAAPYWPLPEDWKEEELTVKGHFIYSIYGVYVR